MRVHGAADLNELLDRDHAVAIRRHGPSVPSVIRGAVDRGELSCVLPGVYARTPHDPLTRMAALQLKYPDTVFTHLSAAGLLWDPRHLPSVVTGTGRMRTRRGGYTLTERMIDPEWIVTVQGLRCTSPELTAIDLIPSRGGTFVDETLRAARGGGREALERMWRAFHAHPNRRGNGLRRTILTESRDIPWSEAERRSHTLLRENGITGWEANHDVWIEAKNYVIDLAFPALKIAVEIDGYRHHSSRAAFERDREKQNALVRDGWIVLRFTWAMVQSDGFLATIEAVLGTRA